MLHQRLRNSTGTHPIVVFSKCHAIGGHSEHHTGFVPLAKVPPQSHGIHTRQCICKLLVEGLHSEKLLSQCQATSVNLLVACFR